MPCSMRHSQRCGHIQVALLDRVKQLCVVLSSLAWLGLQGASICPAQASSHEVLQGTARVVDGDTIYVSGRKIRLWGLDAPEKAQACKTRAGDSYACGQVSLQALQTKLGSSEVVCEVKTTDQYGRAVSKCYIPHLFGDAEDVGSWLVGNGLAVSYRQYSKVYIPDEAEARVAKRGVWQGPFELPSEWRKARRSEHGESRNSKEHRKGDHAHLLKAEL